MPSLTPYLIFNGNCEEAFNFYKSVFGGEFLMISRFKDMPDQQCNAADENRIMHVHLPIGGHGALLGSDSSTVYGEPKIGDNFSISLTTNTETETRKLFNGLSAGGQITMPLEKTFWAPLFGMFADKFGVNWMVNYAPEEKDITV